MARHGATAAASGGTSAEAEAEQKRPCYKMGLTKRATSQDEHSHSRRNEIMAMWSGYGNGRDECGWERRPDHWGCEEWHWRKCLCIYLILHRMKLGVRIATTATRWQWFKVYAKITNVWEFIAQKRTDNQFFIYIFPPWIFHIFFEEML